MTTMTTSHTRQVVAMVVMVVMVPARRATMSGNPDMMTRLG
jgi:hypothetical protein